MGFLASKIILRQELGNNLLLWIIQYGVLKETKIEIKISLECWDHSVFDLEKNIFLSASIQKLR